MRINFHQREKQFLLWHERFAIYYVNGATVCFDIFNRALNKPLSAVLLFQKKK